MMREKLLTCRRGNVPMRGGGKDQGICDWQLGGRVTPAMDSRFRGNDSLGVRTHAGSVERSMRIQGVCRWSTSILAF